VFGRIEVIFSQFFSCHPSHVPNKIKAKSEST
jgi:hypothetical protein